MKITQGSFHLHLHRGPLPLHGAPSRLLQPLQPEASVSDGQNGPIGFVVVGITFFLRSSIAEPGDQDAKHKADNQRDHCGHH